MTGATITYTRAVYTCWDAEHCAGPADGETIEASGYPLLGALGAAEEYARRWDRESGEGGAPDRVVSVQAPDGTVSRVRVRAQVAVDYRGEVLP